MGAAQGGWEPIYFVTNLGVDGGSPWGWGSLRQHTFSLLVGPASLLSRPRKAKPLFQEMAAIETVFIDGEEYKLLDNNRFFIGEDKIKEAAGKSPWEAVENGVVTLVPGMQYARQRQPGASCVAAVEAVEAVETVLKQC